MLEEKFVIWENYCDTIQKPNEYSNNGKLRYKKMKTYISIDYKKKC